MVSAAVKRLAAGGTLSSTVQVVDGQRVRYRIPKRGQSSNIGSRAVAIGTARTLQSTNKRSVFCTREGRKVATRTKGAKLYKCKKGGRFAAA